MGKNENTVTISVKTDTYDDFVNVKSMLQQNKLFRERLKRNQRRNTVTWDDVAKFLVQLSKYAEINEKVMENAILTIYMN